MMLPCFIVCMTSTISSPRPAPPIPAFAVTPRIEDLGERAGDSFSVGITSLKGDNQEDEARQSQQYHFQLTVPMATKTFDHLPENGLVEAAYLKPDPISEEVADSELDSSIPSAKDAGAQSRRSSSAAKDEVSASEDYEHDSSSQDDDDSLDQPSIQDSDILVDNRDDSVQRDPRKGPTPVSDLEENIIVANQSEDIRKIPSAQSQEIRKSTIRPSAEDTGSEVTTKVIENEPSGETLQSPSSGIEEEDKLVDNRVNWKDLQMSDITRDLDDLTQKLLEDYRARPRFDHERNRERIRLELDILGDQVDRLHEHVARQQASKNTDELIEAKSFIAQLRIELEQERHTSELLRAEVNRLNTVVEEYRKDRDNGLKNFRQQIHEAHQLFNYARDKRERETLLKSKECTQVLDDMLDRIESFRMRKFPDRPTCTYRPRSNHTHETVYELRPVCVCSDHVCGHREYKQRLLDIQERQWDTMLSKR